MLAALPPKPSPIILNRNGKKIVEVFTGTYAEPKWMSLPYSKIQHERAEA